MTAPAAPAPPPAPAQSPAARVNALVERAIQRHGSAEIALSVAMAQTVTLEDQSLADRQTIAELRDKVPDPAKVTVMPKADADRLAALGSLNLTPEQVTALVKENGDLKGKVATHDITDRARKGAPSMGYDPDATASLIATKQLHSELREVEVEITTNGKKEKVKQQHLFVRPAADDKAPLQSLADFAKTLPAFEQRALAATPTQPATATAAPGPSWPTQQPSPAGGTPPADPVAAHIQKQAELSRQKPHPFIPRSAAAPAAATP